MEASGTLGMDRRSGWVSAADALCEGNRLCRRARQARCCGHKRVSASSVSQHKVSDRFRRFPHADFYVITQPVQAVHEFTLGKVREFATQQTRHLGLGKAHTLCGIGNTGAVLQSDVTVAYMSFYNHLFYKAANFDQSVQAMRHASGDHNFYYAVGQQVKDQRIYEMQSQLPVNPWPNPQPSF